MRLTADLKGLSAVPAFRTLLAVRLISQTGDGLVQAGLAALFFFRPQNLTSVTGVALALVVMLAPFTLVGPFTGPFIDRWRRRQILLWGNLLRAGIIAATAVMLQVVGVGAAIYALVLIALGINRFLLAVLSAGLPQIIHRERLLVANSIVPTMGGAASAVGAITGVVLRLVLPAGPAQDTASLAVAVGMYCAAAAMVTRLGIGQLGPQDWDASTGGRGAGLGRALATTLRELGQAVRYLVRRGTPGLALSTMALHRLVYGMQLITIIVSSRNLLAPPHDADAGLAAFGALMGAMLAGQGLSMLLTPLAHERIAPSAWVVICLLGGSAGQAVLVSTHERAWMCVGLFVFGIGVQGAKIAVDTIIQSDTADAYRGRAFSIYDVLFNTAECLAAGTAVLVMPAVGWDRGLQAGLMVMAWAVAAWCWWGMRRLGGRPREA